MGQIHLSEVQCLGPEKSLWSCPHKNVTQQDCRHSEDAGVRCNVPYMAHETTVGWAGKRGGDGGRVQAVPLASGQSADQGLGGSPRAGAPLLTGWGKASMAPKPPQQSSSRCLT